MIMIYNAVFFFSELQFANEKDIANHSGVPKAAYTNYIASY